MAPLVGSDSRRSILDCASSVSVMNIRLGAALQELPSSENTLIGVLLAIPPE